MALWTGKCGKSYWSIHMASGQEILFHADRLVFQQDGAVAAFKDEEGDAGTPMLVVASGRWVLAYAASVIDGSPCCVDHWHSDEPAAARKSKRHKGC